MPHSLSPVISVIALIIGVSALQSTLNAPSEHISPPYGVETAFPHLHFSNPVGIYSAGDGGNRLFVVEQGGVIKVFENSPNATRPACF